MQIALEACLLKKSVDLLDDRNGIILWSGRGHLDSILSGSTKALGLPSGRPA